MWLFKKKKYESKYNDDYFDEMYKTMPQFVGKNTKTAIEGIEGTRRLIKSHGKDFEFKEPPLNMIVQALKRDKEDEAFDSGYPLYIQAKLAYGSKRYIEGIELCKQALSVGYTNPNVYERMAMCYRKLKQYDNEIYILKECLLVSANTSGSKQLSESFLYRIGRAQILKDKQSQKNIKN